MLAQGVGQLGFVCYFENWPIPLDCIKSNSSVIIFGSSMVGGAGTSVSTASRRMVFVGFFQNESWEPVYNDGLTEVSYCTNFLSN